MINIKDKLKSLFKPVSIYYKGKAGERKVKVKLTSFLFGKSKCKVISNLILIDENNYTHQIDHVVIKTNGIFCLETKNLNGLIYGNELHKNWTQVFSVNRKFKFYNPIKQNKSHAYHLSKALNDLYKINSIVVMVNNNANKIKSLNIVNLVDLKKYLINYNDNIVLSKKEINNIYNKLNELNNKNISLKAHINSIKRIETNINEGICPRCNSKLVKRISKYGTFIGCSNYPRCRFTKSINNDNNINN